MRVHPPRRGRLLLFFAGGQLWDLSSLFQTTNCQLLNLMAQATLTISASVFISSSGEIKALAMRNLSLHLACGGGSWSRGCSKTT